MKKNISILGVTGSIGKSALKIFDNFPEELEIISISTNKNIKLLLEIINKYKPRFAVVTDQKSMFDYFKEYEANYNQTKILSGNKNLELICSNNKNNIILNGICGIAGLIPSLTILQNGINLALANKESMVCAGNILNKLAQNNNCKIIPVDSEHSAIFQLLEKHEHRFIKNVFLTASGGPFLNLDKKDWDKITLKDALNHPTWKMGNKITIDSATMANKGLEVIEANQLFGLDYNNIKVMIHPQSLIHSFIECIDGETYAQIGPNDMSIPIQNALFHPEMKLNNYNRLDFSKGFDLKLIPVDFNKFRMLELAYFCGNKGGLYPAFYNMINEKLVEYFLENKITFLQIEYLMQKALDIFDKSYENKNNDYSIEDITNLINITGTFIKI